MKSIFYMHENFIFIGEISMHENDIRLHENNIFVHERESFAHKDYKHGIFIYEIFHSFILVQTA